MRHPRVPYTDAGFTLMEVMVVVVILGILATVVVVNVVGHADDARRKRAQSDILTIESALSMYHLKNSTYPETLEELEPKYIKRLQNDPWKRPYVFQYPGSHGEIDIMSLGADGQPGGEDTSADIGNWDLR